MLKLSKNIIDKIRGIPGVILEMNKDLTKFSTMRAESSGSIISVEVKDGLVKLLPLLAENNYSYRVIGRGANFVLPRNPDYVLIKLNFLFEKDQFFSKDSSFLIPASASLGQLTALAIKHGLKGWECITGVPGSVGGAIFMNAGTSLGEISSLILKVWLMNNKGEIRLHEVDDESFSYRKNNFILVGEVIIQVEMKHNGIDLKVADIIKNYLILRQETQPLKEKTCGCMFKNKKINEKTCPAGLYLDIMGLTGFSLNKFRVSPKHANFLENTGGGDYFGVQNILAFVSNELNDQYGIEFEQEIQF